MRCPQPKYNREGAKGAKTDAKENAATLVFFLLAFSSSRRREEHVRAKAQVAKSAKEEGGDPVIPPFLALLAPWRFSVFLLRVFPNP